MVCRFPRCWAMCWRYLHPISLLGKHISSRGRLFGRAPRRSNLTSSQHRLCILSLGEKEGTMGGQVRGRTKDECWRNYIDDKPTRGGALLYVIPNNKQDAYEAMKKDNQIGIWTLEFVFTV
jgi:hypothetical protein